MRRFTRWSNEIPEEIRAFVLTLVQSAPVDGEFLYDLIGGDIIHTSALPEGPYDLEESLPHFKCAATVTNNAGGDLFFIAVQGDDTAIG